MGAVIQMDMSVKLYWCAEQWGMSVFCLTLCTGDIIIVNTVYSLLSALMNRKRHRDNPMIICGCDWENYWIKKFRNVCTMCDSVLSATFVRNIFRPDKYLASCAPNTCSNAHHVMWLLKLTSVKVGMAGQFFIKFSNIKVN